VTGLAANATFQVTVTDNGVTKSYTATVNAVGVWTATIPTADAVALANGTATVSAQVTDINGNQSTVATQLVTVAETLPTVTERLASDTGSLATDNITSNDALTGTGIANTVVHFSVDGTAIAATTTANAQGVWSFTPAGLADGAHTIVASQTDGFGNTGTASLSFTLDTDVPTVAIGTINTATHTISGTADGADAGTTIAILDSVTTYSPLTPYAAALLTAGHNLTNGLGGSAGFGNNVVPIGDDNSSAAINITSVFGAAGINFFGHNYTSLYINNNGNITFAGPNPTYTPSAISAGANNPIIAPFWADVDTRGGAGTPTGGNATGANQIFYNLDSVDGVLTITWDDVGYYNQAKDKLDAFQVQLISLGGGNFDIVYRYESINWTTGSASGGTNGLGGTPARAGYSAGDGNSAHYFELPQSGIQAALLALPTTAGNTGIAGVDVFQVLNGQVGTPTVTTIGTATVQSDGTWSTNVTLPGGTNTLTAQETDLAGNTGTSAPVTLNETNTAPAGVAGSAINLGLTQLAGVGSKAVTVTGSPLNWTMEGATHNADGSWTALTNDFSTLTITPDVNFVGAIALNVVETWTNPGGSVGSMVVSDNVEAYAPGSPIFALAGDDHLTGTSSADLFVFAQPIGNDIIYNFNAASDKIDLIGFNNIASFADIQGNIADDADGNAVIKIGANETITLNGVHAASVTASGFVFNQAPITENPGTMQIGHGAHLPLSGTINNTGTIELNSTGDETDLQLIEHGIALTGAGHVVLSDSAENVISGTSADVTMTNVDNTISGAGQIGTGKLTLINKGTIDATGASSLTVDTGVNVVTNSGTLEATGSGGLIVHSDVVNTGVLWANGGNVLLEGNVSGNGSALISGSATLEFAAASAEKTAFASGSTGTLVLDHAFDFSGIVSGMTASNHLDLLDFSFAKGTTINYTASADGSGGTLSVADGAHTANIALLGHFNPAGFQAGVDHGTGTLISYHGILLV
jgi:Bacterial Ig-like domain/Nidogen-like